MRCFNAHRVSRTFSPTGTLKSMLNLRLNYLKPSQPLFTRFYHSQNKTERRVFMMSKFGPPINRDMKQLDREFFTKQVPLVVLVFPDPSKLGKFAKDCKQDVLFLPSVKHIVDVDGQKGMLLNEKFHDVDDLEKLSDNSKLLMKQFNLQPQPYSFKLDYNFWKADDILRAILPEHLLDEIPSGFAQAGHVAHINLREEFKPYGKLIGQVILDKNSKVETVVNKVDSIATKFRTFQMQVLAGRDDLVVEQIESGCKFKFDFSKVYWNSRLNTEHERLIDLFDSHGVVGDVFAGVGPFAIPAGKKKVFVIANDLNPESFKYLNENIKANKTESFVKSSYLDGREFIRQSPKLLLEWANTTEPIEEKKLVKKRKHLENQPAVYETKHYTIPKYFGNYVMNLPDSALSFLDEFIGLYSNDPEVEAAVRKLDDFKLPVINVHCFEKFSVTEPEPTMEELHSRIHKKIIKLIDFDLPIDQFKFHLVRKVAPTKPMFCVSFTLPEEVAFRKK